VALAGSSRQAFLDHRAIGWPLRAASRHRQSLALRLLSLSPHYFIYQWERYPSSWSRRRVLEAESERNRQSRRQIAEQIIAPRISGDTTVLDFGCGAGFLAGQLHTLAREVVGVGVSSGTLACAHVLNPGGVPRRALNPAQLPARDPVIYDTAVLQAAGIQPDSRVLDLGCGQGDLTLALLARGAAVTSLDISPGMVEIARKRVELHGQGRRVQFVLAPIEATSLPSQSFDLIVGRWILHHVDLVAAGPELARILVPGGRMVFLENSGANPVLNFARNQIAGRFGVPRFGTEDERPLTAEDWAVLERSFGRVRAEFPIVEFFELFNRQVLRYRWRSLAAVCRQLDASLGRMRALRKYSYRVLVIAETDSPPGGRVASPAP
jgi:ubiquinone/menaquinone biosynthesis C-methylase UbiE